MNNRAADLEIPASGIALHELALTADTIQTVHSRGGRGLSSTLEVLVHAADSPVYWTVDGSDPSVRGANCYVLPAAITTQDTTSARTSTRGTLKFITAGSATISITRY